MAQAQPIVYAPAPSKLPPPERMFFYGMGLVAVGGAIYFAREYFLNKQSSTAADYLPYDTGTGNKTVSVKRTDAFPLKKGSTGARVKQLQTALATIIGTDAMNQDGGIDGKFGPGTADALSKAGYGPTVDEATFSKITGTTGTGSGASTVSNPSQEAMNLYLAANSGNVSSVIGALQRIKNVADYSAVNEAFKTVTDNYTAVRKTIVTGLLDSYFSDNASAKEQIKAQFRRIGLKEDTASQKWSLSAYLMLYVTSRPYSPLTWWTKPATVYLYERMLSWAQL